MCSGVAAVVAFAVGFFFSSAAAPLGPETRHTRCPVCQEREGVGTKNRGVGWDLEVLGRTRDV